MISEGKILYGNLDELREYFNFVGKMKATKWIEDLGFDKQVESVDKSKNNGPTRLIFWIDKSYSFSIKKTMIFIRDLQKEKK